MHSAICLRGVECKTGSNLRSLISCCITAEAPQWNDVSSQPTRKWREIPTWCNNLFIII